MTKKVDVFWSMNSPYCYFMLDCSRSAYGEDLPLLEADAT